MDKYVKLNRDANSFLPVKGPYKFSFYMSREISRLEEGYNWFPLKYRLSAGKPFEQKKKQKTKKTRKYCILETQAF